MLKFKLKVFFHEITFTKKLPGSNFLLPSNLTGGKWDFQVEICYLLLLISNPEFLTTGRTIDTLTHVFATFSQLYVTTYSLLVACHFLSDPLSVPI